MAGRELEIAREVQSKLLPQRAPVLESLDYAGVCIQARLVGGDYYDFLYLGPGRLGLVLADISGKGISAALLMASLQASLRSHYAQAPDDLPRVLRAVNQTFFESTATCCVLRAVCYVLCAMCYELRDIGRAWTIAHSYSGLGPINDFRT
jgi:phosphoserine phosphatase RsbU/P